MWIDTHAHLDAPEFAPNREAVLQRAQAAGVGLVVLPAVEVPQIAALQAWARAHRQPYALGIHPLFAHRAGSDDLMLLEQALRAARDDPLLVAVGEIGVDGFVPGLDLAVQQTVYEQQLRLARALELPVLLHVRRSADALLKGLRRHAVIGGIAHAFNGSLQQAQALMDRGFALGFGGAMTHERSLQIRRLAAAVPASAVVLETDAPDIPPAWLYRTAAERAQGFAQGRNEPAELPRIAQTLAELRGWTLEETARQTTANACRVLPRLAALCEGALARAT